MKRTLTALATGALVATGTAIAQTPETAKPASTWAEKVTLSGDVRFRFESIDAEGKDQRDRTRIRARIGALAKPGSDLDIGVQLSTSEGNDPVSGNQTLGKGASRKDVFFDQAYLNYHPESLPGFNAIGGKMEHPFIRVADLMWDNDLNPEGLAVKYKAGEDVQFLLNGGAFWVEERSADDETMLFGGQAAVKFKQEGGSHVLAGVSLFSYDGIEGQSPLFDSEKAFGNSTDKVVDGDETNLVYANGFSIPEVFGEVQMAGDLPVALYGSYIVNSDADDEDTGYIAGVRVGKAKAPGSWELDYNWRHLEANAAVGLFADSDSFGGGTDGEGHKLSGSYQLSKTLKSTVTYFMNEAKLTKGGEDYDRLQVDFSAKF